MPEQQFAKLLNELSPEELKDIIHKLPYEKVTTVIGQSGDKHQLNLIVRVLEEKIEEQGELINKMRKELKEFITPPPMDSPSIIGEEYHGFGLV